MQRTPEAELMDDPAQAQAYAQADFSEPHNHFIELLEQHGGITAPGHVLDLGCGPGDICRRFARRFPDCHIHAVDAAEAMLTLARSETVAQGLDSCIEYFHGYLPEAQLPRRHYAFIMSNSLLHHLADPAVLWQACTAHGRPGTGVFIMDLMRPDSLEQAAHLQQTYAADEPEVLRQDFYNSLLAAYRPDEVRAQLAQQGLEQLQVEVVSDRHFIVHGRL
ncbi:MAG TPA: class I SAM-dependent methyltransferase [Gammaproteobacteria bacterium]|nr:class I SAM-dependent methyltransferase [Gammaproteobacteria bacterium]